MKINLNRKPEAVVLIVALFVIVSAGIALASYLTLMASETRVIGRSQTWNKCVPVMEAGVEEAMAQIQYCNGTTNLGSNGWTRNVTNYYQKTRYVGANGCYCVVRIQPVNPPVIFSTAYVPIPDTTSNYLTRTVRVSTTNGIGSGGLIAKGTITMSGGTQLDSYNSKLAAYNASAPGTNAIAKTLSTNSHSINLGPKGSAHIYGMAVTGPGGTIGMGGGAYIGPPDASGNIPSGSGGTISSGWTNNDSNFQINSNSAPNTSGWYSYSAPPSGGGLLGLLGLSTNAYTYVFTTGNYQINNSISLSSIQTMGISGNVKIYVTGGFSVANGAEVDIGAGSSLTLYVAGNINISGAGIVNKTANATALTIYGLSSCTSVTIGNSGAFYGSINAPNAAVTVSGSGDVYGQITGNSITVSGGGNVHYDQALGGSQFFNAYSWNEL